MLSPVRIDIKHDDLWKQSNKWPGSIQIEFISIKDIPNSHFNYLENPLNENKPVF